ncbi:2-oxoglutarate dehydrogenase, E2 component, dihydrolipoamide succinyltransferase [Aliifodinibius salipaludis]|uniref:Dihydrolipoamide acetyltransferase component of pyruvate dehydrogenase complex n=1 Tax=Fodinibius salipaludis TaxID=2032627 RepID=A0A2A2GDB9_9BACT|nr:2-oxoglutarate dehydrogenase, E2 component, dihydrolipoamide succinyltransferase [Aliifodinibius salipaludis]PAU94907.1 2-oxoglutarate dehydrogenase, E2 component, dihydrolipoamide succinyltransferase [Aliifodinibius salipaludis]
MARVEVEMPQMGESVMEGTVIEWAKEIGDSVEEDETLLEIATDKVDTEVPSPQAGILIEKLAEEGDTIEVGQAIAIIETDADEADVSAGGGSAEEETEAEEPETEEEPQQEEVVAQESSEEEPSGGDTDEEGERVEVQMPQMGESVMEGTVIEWAKSIGDEVEEDETLLEISTDKVDTEVPSPQAGTLVEILVEEGDTVEVGQTIAIIATGKAASASADTKSASTADTQKTKEETTSTQKTESKPAEASTSSNGAPSGGTEPQRIGSDGRFYSPLVRSIAKEEGISQEELESIEGSGQGGRVSKEDMMNYLKERKAQPEQQSQPAAQPSGGLSKPSTESKPASQGKKGSISAGELDIQRPSENVERIKMDRMRKMIAEHMVRSKQTSAHVTTFSEVDVTNLVRWREENKHKFQERAGVKLTYTPLFIEKIIQAIREFPLINSSVDTENDEIILKRDINFGLAVALGEGGKGGLIVPVIKHAQDKNLVGLAKSVNDLALKARNKNLNPDDLVGGTITLTNYGSVGNLMGTPIINQPQVAIMGTGAIEKRPVVRETSEGDVIAIRHMMYLSMSYDHRIVDGAHGGAFLNRVKELLEDFDTDRAV